MHQWVVVICFASGGLAWAAADGNESKTSALIKLGETLFFDQRLSANGQVSCATCHEPERAFTDGKKTAIGVQGQPTTRNSPSLINVAEVADLFWDGRARSLEEQALQPFTAPPEMGRASMDDVVQQLRTLPDYAPLIRKATGQPVKELKAQVIATALAAYQRTLRASESPFDRYYFKGQTQALSTPAQRGLALFTGQAGCSSCHRIEKDAASFTDQEFHAIGFRGDAARLAGAIKRLTQTPAPSIGHLVLTDPEVAALGRFVVTQKLDDIGKFRTPSLRNVALTAPYMHDGALETLEAAIDYELYYRGQADGTPRVLTPEERADLAAFLRALSSGRLTR